MEEEMGGRETDRKGDLDDEERAGNVGEAMALAGGGSGRPGSVWGGVWGGVWADGVAGRG
jgi:hypothetical protein